MISFQFKRFGQLLKLYIATNQHFLFNRALLNFAAFLLLFLYIGFVNRKAVVMGDGSLHDHSSDTMNTCAGIFLFVLAVEFIINPALLLCNLRTKQQRTAFLTLPASAGEKYLTCWTTQFLLLILLSVAAFLAADVVRWVLYAALFPSLHGWVSAAAWDIVAETFRSLGRLDGSVRNTADSVSILVCVVSFNVFLHSFFLVCGTVFNRHQWVVGILAGVFGLLVLLATPLPYLIRYDDAHIHNVQVLSGVLLLLSAGGYWLSFRLFKRLQMTNRKWINL